MNPHTPAGRPSDPAPLPGYGNPIPAGYGQPDRAAEPLTPAVDPWPSAPVLPMGYYGSDTDPSSMDILVHSPPPAGGTGGRPRLLVLAGVVLVLLVGAGVAVALTAGGGRTGRAAWVRLAPAPIPFEGAGVAAFGKKLWVIGGVFAQEDRHLMADTQVYDPATKSWSTGPAMPQGRAFASVVSTGKDLYVIGGQLQAGATATVLHLTPDGTGWEAAAPLPEPRETGAAIWDGTRIVFAGGVTSGGGATADIFVLAGSAWTRLDTGLRVAREKLAAATDGLGTAYFMGGRDPKAAQVVPMAAVDVVNSNGTVRPGNDLAVAVHSGAGGYIPGIGVCVIGGQTDTGFSAGASCLSRDKTALVAPLARARAGLGVAIIDNTVYAVGGYDDGVHGGGDLESLSAPAG